MTIAPIAATPPPRGASSPEGWTVLESRVVVIDGVHVQYQFAHKTTRDANGNAHDNATVSMVWPHGMKVMATDGFQRGMSDAALIEKMRGVMSSERKP